VSYSAHWSPLAWRCFQFLMFQLCFKLRAFYLHAPVSDMFFLLLACLFVSIYTVFESMNKKKNVHNFQLCPLISTVTLEVQRGRTFQNESLWYGIEGNHLHKNLEKHILPWHAWPGIFPYKPQLNLFVILFSKHILFIVWFL